MFIFGYLFNGKMPLCTNLSTRGSLRPPPFPTNLGYVPHRWYPTEKTSAKPLLSPWKSKYVTEKKTTACRSLSTDAETEVFTIALC